MLLGSTIQRKFDEWQRPQTITAKKPTGSVIWDRNLSFTPGNNISSITDNGTPKNYGYDALNQIIVAPEGATTYDAVGNRINTPGVSVPYTVNALNQVTSDGVNSYGYSANGEMTAKVGPSGTWAYSYNAEGRLENVSKNNQNVATYSYDVFNRRVKKTVAATQSNPETTTYFLYSDTGLVGEYNSTGNEVRAYGWKPGSTWGTDPVWLRESGQTYFYVNDHLGTPKKLVSVSGDSVWSAEHDTYGKASVNLVSTVVNPLRFPGQYEDVETGWHYNFHRYYIPELGRYNRLDPIKDSINWYAYAGNDSVNMFDSLGLFEFTGGASGGLTVLLPINPKGYPKAALGFEITKSLVGNTSDCKTCITYQISALYGYGMLVSLGGGFTGAFTTTTDGPSISLGVGGGAGNGRAGATGAVDFPLYPNPSANPSAIGVSHFGPTIGGGLYIRNNYSCTGCGSTPLRAEINAWKCIFGLLSKLSK